SARTASSVNSSNSPRRSPFMVHLRRRDITISSCLYRKSTTCLRPAYVRDAGSESWRFLCAQQHRVDLIAARTLRDIQRLVGGAEECFSHFRIAVWTRRRHVEMSTAGEPQTDR